MTARTPRIPPTPARPHVAGKVAGSYWSRMRCGTQEPFSDAEVLSEVVDWMANHLPCVAGRREYNKGRYFIRAATRASVPEIFAKFKQALELDQAVACLYVFNSPGHNNSSATVFDVFEFLAEQMEPISTLSAADLARGAPLTNSIELNCPVTGLRTVFDDFECIAFCPQSDDATDPLYDPLLAMPYPCVNMSSDVYAFSRFVADAVERALGHSAWREADLDGLEELFHACVQRWQRIATTTIGKYESLTDTTICPVHVTADGRHWIANHKDPAFAEAVKEVHQHELPIRYARRITDGWMRHFRGAGKYSAAGLARDGLPVGQGVTGVAWSAAIAD